MPERFRLVRIFRDCWHSSFFLAGRFSRTLRWSDSIRVMQETEMSCAIPEAIGGPPRGTKVCASYLGDGSASSEVTRTLR